MKIFLFGYGRMGKEIEKLAIEKGHELIGIYDPYDQKFNKSNQKAFEKCDIAIDYSTPGSAVYNMTKCFENNKPVIVGTTGWYDELEIVKKLCNTYNGSMLYATNFSIGVNILFKMVDVLSSFMTGQHGYDVIVSEIHHSKKKDSPSGTAITLAEKILKNHLNLKDWFKVEMGSEFEKVPSKLPIAYSRENDVIGIHNVIYTSSLDKIKVEHEAFNREGFAIGTLIAAEWLLGKKGFFTMENVLNK